MTNTDFNIEFDLLYNNALSNSAPSLNTYEKSLFLTKAQEIVVRNLYEDLQSEQSVEKTERIRRRLQPLITPATSTYNSSFDTSLNSFKISSNSRFFVINDNVWYILYERGYTASTDIKIIPVTLDQYNILKSNPFKQPNAEKAWRLDVNNMVDSSKVVEIISTLTLTSYKYRYLKQPQPIVLVNLATDPEYSGMGLTIEGISAETPTALPNEVHRTLLDKAVELATVAYKENTLANNVQLNQNNNF